MEKNNVNFEASGNSVTMRYELMPSDVLDDTALDRLKMNLIEMTAPIHYTEDGPKRVIYSQIPSAVPLSSYLKKPLSKGEVLTIVRNLVTGMDIGKHSIPVSYIIKDSGYIYIDEQTLDTYAFVLPIKNQTMDVSEIPDFFRDVISRMKFSEDDKDNYVAKLLTNVNSDRFTLGNLNVLVNELLVEYGDAQLAGAPQMGARVDKVGVLRNRAGAVPMQPQMNQMYGQQPQMNQMYGQPQMNQMYGQQPQMNQMYGQQPQMNQMQMQPQMNQMQMQPQMNQMQQQPQPMNQMQQQPQAPQGPVRRFDPMTGQPIVDAPQAPQPPIQRFDPMTGQPIVAPEMPEEVKAPEMPEAPQDEEKIEEATEKAEEVAEEVTEKPEETAEEATEKAEETAEEVTEKAEEAVEEVAEKVEEAPEAPQGPQMNAPIPPQGPQMNAPIPPQGPQIPEGPKPMGAVKRFDPMTGKPIDAAPEAPQGPAPQAPEVPQGPKMDAPIPPQGPQIPEGPKPMGAVKRFDPMTGKPIDAAPEAPQGPAPQAPAPQAPEVPQGPKMEAPKAPEGPKPMGAVKRFDPMTGKPIDAAPEAPQGPAPQAPEVPQGPKMDAPIPPQGPQIPEGPKPMGAVKRFDPMTGKPIDAAPEAPQGPAPQGPAPQAPEVPQGPKMDAPIPPQGPQMNAPVPPVQSESEKSKTSKLTEEEKLESASDMVALDLDTIMKEAEEMAPAQADATPHPHFIRKKTGEKIYITKDEFKIGKSRIHADYAIENNSAISRVHVIVIRRNGVNYLKDNDSTNGTYVDGEKLEPGREVLLKANMEVKFGDEDFVFLLREGNR